MRGNEAEKIRQPKSENEALTARQPGHPNEAD